ncbi:MULTISPECIES: two-component sensor histidine kinase BarA [unclassified Colwellia]|jgi:two-component system sensor histidine kinase BarA|uniref:two-component sensor histidine kinase BarA n=1 Tax=unclassified Colwellia TaxID=196834 RepID=UPI0015F5BCEC|nr:MULTISPECIES: two-component sensor histidine kinase BarA [unclassified Colwellia]MBA6347456.1 two-component sensor histidine kinase BarA [Colwellia sp. BRX8-9]MBA6354405.1 two-component sensor histidine kinase BarA [Colwellia sp. BRX8-3]MBA6358328.1 two-component sensor histidine kinase BarA [Colwellia sp. BRX8-6]MBA6365919.1 two-component sensor histidine kinase BarA [Colwellia sp. BRX8-5]MBA6370297.1 two-component sensor histidine kinase BarA [Colwellia sp. BRX8-4]
MHKISLKDWVILLTIVPTTLIAFSIASYFSYSRYDELNTFLTQRSQSIIEPLAIASSLGMLNKDRVQLRNLMNFTHRSQSSIIKSIAVFTKDNQVFVTSSYHGDANLLRLKAGQVIPNSTIFSKNGDDFIFHSPIINETLINEATRSMSQDNIGYIAMQIDSSNIRLKQQDQMLFSFLIVLLGSVFSAFFSYRLIKNFTRPIDAMVLAVDRIREGKLESRVTGQLIGELNFLKNGVNAMAQSLGDYQEEMQGSIDQATTDLRESLEQFEIQNVELDIAKRKAQEANKVKSEFLANMSHELRTPLNGVIGFTRQVLKTPLTITQRDYLQTIERSSANLLAIINDILDFSKLDAGKMVIENIPFSMRAAVEETLTLLAPTSHKKNIELSLRVNPQLPDALIGDAMRIKQVLINLTSNAMKFTDKGSVDIDVDSERIENNIAVLKVTIKDTGIGMNHEQQKTIFEAFGQADKSVTRLYGGTGLGLVISQRLVTEMNGNMGFSTEQGQGSTFWFTFRCEVNPISIDNIFDNHELAGKSVLYFEPHTHSRIATSEILTDWNLAVHPVQNLVQVNDLLNEKVHFDFALISHDITPTALVELKELIVTLSKNVTQIHLAINSNSPNLQEALIACGAKSCLSKPITPERLNKVLLPRNHLLDIVRSTSEDNKIPVKILAVDDNEANLKLINELLLEQVNEVTTVVNGQEAVDICKHEKFAMIFMDIQMPIMDGISALKSIKAITFNDNTPVIAVTAHALKEEKDKLLKLGFDSYMTKPIDEAMLRHCIYEYCDLTQPQNIKTMKNKNIDNTDLNQQAFDTNNATIMHRRNHQVIDWPLALKRAGNKEELAKEMFKGLVQSLPETKLNISEALTSQDVEQLKVLIHKLNGACCYSGVPSLGRVVHQIETELKSGVTIDDLEPEFFEFFEHIDNVINQAPEVFNKKPNIEH